MSGREPSYAPLSFGRFAQLKINRFRRKFRFKQVREEFDTAVREGAGKVCIDLGANVGEFTRVMAAHAGKVYAFEPDPWAADQLRNAVADLDNVEIIEAAAGTFDGEIQIFRGLGFDGDPGKKSKSSSIIADKNDLDPDSAITVPIVDFCRFLRELETDVAVIKIDIEGAEVDLLEGLLDDPVMARIGHVFVETHETKVPALAERSETLRARVRGLTRPVVNMNWR